jgi:hypothetical protein
MRHAWLVVLLAVGCGISGEPLEGDVAITYGGDMPDLAVGTAVRATDDPTHMVVQLGSDNVDCDTYLDVFFDLGGPKGTFVYFNIADQPATYDSTSVYVNHTEGHSTNINGAQGAVTITAVEPRVTGTITVATTDDEIGEITVGGAFDVKRCF